MSGAKRIENGRCDALTFLRQASRAVCGAHPNNDTDTLRRVTRLVESARVALAEERERVVTQLREIAAAVDEAHDHLHAASDHTDADRLAPIRCAHDALHVAVNALNSTGTAAQPQNLAGRIRGLLDDRMTRWLDACAAYEQTQDARDRRHAAALLAMIGALKDAHVAAARGDTYGLTVMIDDLRDGDSTDRTAEGIALALEAADDLERVLREHEAQR